MSEPGRGLRYIFSLLNTLGQLEQEGLAEESAFLRRLSTLRNTSNGPDSVDKRMGRPFSSWHYFLERFRWLGLLRGIRWLPHMVRQARWLLDEHSESQREKACVVVIASNRLCLDRIDLSPREWFSLLARPINGKSDFGKIEASILSSDLVLIFDALPVSRFWALAKRCHEDNVFIVDGAFLLVWTIFSLLRSKKYCSEFLELLNEIWKVRDEFMRSHQHSFRLGKGLAATQATLSIAWALRGFNSIDAVLFTSHSFLTELARAYLLSLPKCRWVVEIMHGAGSLQAERFIARRLEAAERVGGSSKKLVFVPQVSNLPLHGVFQKQALSNDDFSINSYLNQFFLNRRGEQRSRAAMLDSLIEEYSAAFAQTQPRCPAPIVIAVFGYSTIDQRLQDSLSFQAECMLMAMIQKYLMEREHAHRIIYVPHPLFKGSEIEHPFIAEHAIVVHWESVIWWLFADICVSLVSSTLFEAAYFGSRVITPLLNSDNIFPEAYLDLVHHPNIDSYEALGDAVRTALEPIRPIEPMDRVKRVKRALESLPLAGMEPSRLLLNEKPICPR